MDSFAPVCIFAYKRVDHLAHTVEMLSDNYLADATDLIIFSDGAKDNYDINNVDAVRNYSNKITGFKSVKLVSRDRNYGLSKNVITGVSEVLKTYNKVIVMEDDMETSPWFISYMNEALQKYEFNNKVGCIHGYLYPDIHIEKPFFLRGADCWGWATWRSTWEKFNSNSFMLFSELKKRGLFYKFDFDGSYPYSKMLRHNMLGKNDSWAIRWYASLFLSNMWTLYPSKSLIKNIGHDGSGTNCGVTDSFEVLLSDVKISLHDVKIEESKFAREKFKSYFFSLESNPIKRSVKKLRGMLSVFGFVV